MKLANTVTGDITSHCGSDDSDWEDEEAEGDSEAAQHLSQDQHMETDKESSTQHVDDIDESYSMATYDQEKEGMCTIIF